VKKQVKRSRGAIYAQRLFEARELGVNTTEPHVHYVIEEFARVVDAIPMRWIQMPKGILLFLASSKNANSGVIFVYDRAAQQFYFVFFQGDSVHCTLQEFSELLREYKLVEFAENPSLLTARVRAAAKRRSASNPQIESTSGGGK